MDSATAAVLHLEDNDLDAELVRDRLERSGLPLVLERVSDRAAFLARITGRRYDLILSDYQVPGFDGLAALELAREHQPGVPVIIVSGALGEEVAVDTLKRGATDYILKERLARLAPAVERALADARERAELRRAEESLRESERRLRTLSDNLPDGAIYQIVADGKGGGRFTYVSAGVERLFGVPPAEILADPVALYGLIHEDDRERMRAAEEAVLRGLAPFDCEFRSYTRAGDVRWVHVRSVPRPLPGGESVWDGILLDVTDWRRAERESRISRDRLDLVVNSVDVGLWYCDLPFDKLVWNAKAKEHFGLPADAEVTIDTFYERLHPDDRERTRQAIDRSVRDRTGYDIEYRTVSPGGRERWVRAIGRTFYDAVGRPVSFDGLTVDVTDRVRQEEALKEADRRKDEFLATLAHELRNPLAPIRNGLQVLKLAGERQVQERAREMMERQIGQMVRLIDDLLDVSRITRGKLQLRRERVDLAAVVGQAVETARPHVTAAGHELTVSLPPGSVSLQGDPVRLAQVFSNLLHNASKYTEPGGRIRLVAERQGADVVVSVRDTGVGIAADMLPKVFDMFTQIDRSLGKAQGGLGVGLSLVKRLVELHGGTVEARSAGPSLGSEFIVRLPAAADDAPDAAPPDGAGSDAAPVGRSILVVDDNRDGAESLATMLRVMGHRVRTAHDGLEAVRAAEAFRPDVVLLDIGMPRLSGHEAARRIRAEPWGKGMIIVAVTGWGQEEDRRKSLEAGCDFHMVKPVQAAELVKLLAGLGQGAVAAIGFHLSPSAPRSRE